MKTMNKFISIFALIALFSLTFATPALAFDGRSGENIEIKANEVISDDLYVTANNFVLEGTIKGDLIVMGSTIVINGTVEGDLIAAGQSVTINGIVTDDARIAGAVLQIGKNAVIGGDVIAGSASLEAVTGSLVKGDLVFGTAQTLLDGEISGDVLAATGALDLNGKFDGNVKAEVGNPEDGSPASSLNLPQMNITFPPVKPGFNVGKDAIISGNLEYTQSKDVTIPASAVAGKITRTAPVVDPGKVKAAPTQAEIAMTWTLNLLRTIITWLALGLLLGWLAPAFLKALMDKVQTQPAASLGWGLVAYAAFFFTLLVIFTAMLVGGIIFGVITLGGLSGTIIWLGILAMFIMIVGFVLITAFLTHIIVAWLGGKLILARVKPELAEHKLLPLAIGVIILALFTALPYIGWLFGVFTMFIGLGALWIWGRDLWQARKVTV